MGDFGIKVSQDGYDVKTASEINLLLKSDFNLLKVKTSGIINMSSSVTWYAVYHGLGYVPHFLAFYKKSSGRVYLCTGSSGSAIARADNSYVYVKNEDAINTTAYYYIFYELA